MDYKNFLQSKAVKVKDYGKQPGEVNLILFPFQRDVVRWAVRRGRAAIFLDTGLGKTFCQLEWARLMDEMTLIIAPLSVARQTVREAAKLDIQIKYVREQSEVDDGRIFITNYEMVDNLDISSFGAVVLDESSILKAISGKTRQKLTELCSDVPYRLCCTATPAPNDYTEIGNHAEFLGICSQQEMLSRFFVNANKEHTYNIDGKSYHRKGSNAAGTEWRLKHHAEEAFFQWLASWAMTMMKPSDLGYDDDGFILPELTVTPMFVEAEYTPTDQLFFTRLHGIEDRTKIRKMTIEQRFEMLKEVLASAPDEQWIIWCGLDDESNLLAKSLSGAVEVKGSDKPEDKAQAFEDFQDGKFRILITKIKIGGYGMNFQNAHKMIFFGMNDSWEAFYQAIRREWRYRQQSAVDVYLILSDIESEIYRNVMRKDAMAKRLRAKLIENITIYEKGELKMTDDNIQSVYQEQEVKGVHFTAKLGDSCIRLAEIADNSIDLTVYSPPFADLFTYSPSERDLGNSRDSAEFFEHYKFIIGELLRVTKPGRLSCVHTSDIAAMASRDGYIGVKDFPGEVIRAHEALGWTFTGRAFVQKNPQAQAIRVKSKALLFVQLRKDSSDSRPALVDQVLIFKKPGENAVPITPVEHGELDNETWIEWANGIWLGISESDTLQFTKARDTGDEKHICPLQLGTIERCIKLYSNPGETVLTPFLGIGSEAYQAIRFGRSAIGIELKESYFNTAVKNLQRAEATYRVDLFTWAQEQKDMALEQPNVSAP